MAVHQWYIILCMNLTPNHPDAGSHPSFAHTDHRPWPLPRGRWSWRQSWRDLLFAHWPVPAELIRPHVPPGLAVQEFDGTSWIEASTAGGGNVDGGAAATSYGGTTPINGGSA